MSSGAYLESPGASEEVTARTEHTMDDVGIATRGHQAASEREAASARRAPNGTFWWFTAPRRAPSGTKWRFTAPGPVRVPKAASRHPV